MTYFREVTFWSPKGQTAFVLKETDKMSGLYPFLKAEKLLFSSRLMAQKKS